MTNSNETMMFIVELPSKQHAAARAFLARQKIVEFSSANECMAIQNLYRQLEAENEIKDMSHKLQLSLRGE